MLGHQIEMLRILQHHGGVFAAAFQHDLLEVRVGGVTQEPPPGSTCNTPRGTPASAASSATRRAVIDVCSAGFTITEQPAASAGPIFQVSIRIGKFQGSTALTTPMGSGAMMASASSPAGAVLS